jgi:hypothetical protein
MMDPVPLPDEIVKGYANGTISIVGYEADQVVKTPTGDVHVPIYDAYNHHFMAWLKGSDSTIRQVTDEEAIADGIGNNHGAKEVWRCYDNDDAELSDKE